MPIYKGNPADSQYLNNVESKLIQRHGVESALIQPCFNIVRLLGRDESLTSDFTSFSTVYRSYQGHARLIMKSCAQ